MASSETALAADRKPRGIGPFLRSQMRNIAPFLTLIFLSLFFAFASPS
ncbi:MAG: ABC transporter permease, partial [Bradyrhizobium guangdongense]